ncbi:MAG: PASTA domain-containing protein [Mucinivorans sp.]
MNFFRKIIHKINNHFLLRNIVLAVCGLIVFLYIVSLLLNLFTRHGQQYIVPDLSGFAINETSDMIAEADLELVVIDSLYIAGEKAGAIIDQDPKPTSRVKSGRKIFVVINAVNPKTDIIPYVTGFSLRQAKNMLEGKGFQIERLIYSPDMANNNVIGESYENRQITNGSSVKAPLGSGIVLTVGRSATAPLLSIPKVVGLTLREAKSRLWEVGLNVGEVNRDGEVNVRNEDQARVYRQNPGQQIRADYGSKVTLYLTLNASKIHENSKKSDADARRIPKEEEQDLTPAELEALLAE